MSENGQRAVTVTAVWLLVILVLLWIPWDNQWLPSPTVRELDREWIQGTSGQRASQEPRLLSTAVVLANYTPFSPDPDWREYSWDWRKGSGSVSRHFNIALTNLTEVKFACMLSVGSESTRPKMVIDYQVCSEDGAWEFLDLHQENVTGPTSSRIVDLTLLAPVQNLRNLTSASVVAAEVEISADGIIERDAQILAFSVNAIYEVPLCPVSFDVRSVDEQSFYLNPTMKWFTGPSAIVDVTCAESGRQIIFHPNKANDTLYLQPGNYSGECRWPNSSLQHVVPVEAVIDGGFSTTWAMMLPAVEVFVDVLPELPGCDVTVQTSLGRYYYLSSGHDSFFLPPDTQVSIESRITSVLFPPIPTAYDGVVAVTGSTELIAGTNDRIRIEVVYPYVDFGPVALKPLTVLLLTCLFGSAVCLAIVYRRRGRRVVWKELAKKQGFLPFLFMVVSVFVPWASRSVLLSGPATGQQWTLTESPGLISSFVWAEGSVGILRSATGAELGISLALWTAVALTCIGFMSESTRTTLFGLLIGGIGAVYAYANTYLLPWRLWASPELALLDVGMPALGLLLVALAATSFLVSWRLEGGNQPHA